MCPAAAVFLSVCLSLNQWHIKKNAHKAIHAVQSKTWGMVDQKNKEDVIIHSFIYLLIPGN